MDAGNSDQLTRFLKCLSQFHRYSFGNVLLISMQRPESTHIAGFRTWKKMGRHVRKGEHGIRILAPIVRRRTSRNTEEAVTSEGTDEDQPTVILKSPMAYRTVHVFDVSQTEGDPLPEFARVSGDPGEYIARIRRQIADAGIQLDVDHISGGAEGVSRGGAITIRPDLPPAEEFSVLVHELSHEWLHRSQRRHETTKTIRETEAEAVAFTVCRAIGLETGTSSSDYIQLYNGSRETLQESLQHIRECAARILDHLLTAPVVETEPRDELTPTHPPLPPQARPDDPASVPRTQGQLF